MVAIRDAESDSEEEPPMQKKKMNGNGKMSKPGQSSCVCVNFPAKYTVIWAYGCGEVWISFEITPRDTQKIMKETCKLS